MSSQAKPNILTRGEMAICNWQRGVRHVIFSMRSLILADLSGQVDQMETSKSHPMSGFSAAQLLDFAEEVSEMSASSGLTEETAVENLVRSVRSLGRSITDYFHDADRRQPALLVLKDAARAPVDLLLLREIQQRAEGRDRSEADSRAWATFGPDAVPEGGTGCPRSEEERDGSLDWTDEEIDPVDEENSTLEDDQNGYWDLAEELGMMPWPLRAREPAMAPPAPTPCFERKKGVPSLDLPSGSGVQDSAGLKVFNIASPRTRLSQSVREDDVWDSLAQRLDSATLGGLQRICGAMDVGSNLDVAPSKARILLGAQPFVVGTTRTPGRKTVFLLGGPIGPNGIPCQHSARIKCWTQFTADQCRHPRPGRDQSWPLPGGAGWGASSFCCCWELAWPPLLQGPQGLIPRP